MHTPPPRTPPQIQQISWQHAYPPIAPRADTLDDIIDSYVNLTPEEDASAHAVPPATAPRPSARALGKRRAQRTPSPLPHLNLPKKKKANPPAQQPAPAPQPEPAPLPERFVPPYNVQAYRPEVSYHMQAMPPLTAPPVAPVPPAYVPLPRHGFIHELPQRIAPHSFTPMYMTPNGRFSYYLFADADGWAKVALIGRVDELQELYQDLACRQAPGQAPPYAPAPAPAHGAEW